MPEESLEIAEQKPFVPDTKDKKILQCIMEDARMSYTQIGKKVGLSKESVQYRFKQLLKKNIILKTFPVIDYEKLGYLMFTIQLLLDERDKKRQKEFMRVLQEDPNVMNIREFSDNWDFEIVILAKSLRDFDEVEERLLNPFEELILQKDTGAVINFMRNPAFPDMLGPVNEKFSKQFTRSNENISLDQHDKKILAGLCGDVRISTYKLAPEVGLNADTIGLRIKKLEKLGIIRGYTCELNFLAFGYQRFMFSFSAAALTKKEENAFLYYASHSKNITKVKSMLGTWDLNTYVLVKNPAMLHHIVRDIKMRFAKIIRTYQTMIIFKEHHFNPFPAKLLD